MEPTYSLQAFSDLSLDRLYRILALRAEVFVVEQDCPYQDLDGLDQDALHLEQIVDKKLSGYTRILAPGADFDDAAAIGRVIVAPAFRSNGFGKALMVESISVCRKRWPKLPVKIHAQTYLLEFYTLLGFQSFGDTFLEDGIPHQFMVLQHQDH